MVMRILVVFLATVLSQASNLELPRRDQNEDYHQLLECTSWRVAVEANNVNPWKKIPPDCLDYVKEYLTGKAYRFDLEMVAKQAVEYAKTVALIGDDKDIWIFDVDDTLLSNLPYYADHGYGLDIFDPTEFDKWVDRAAAPAIEATLWLYKEVLQLGFKVVFLTGRSDHQRAATEDNLSQAGFLIWHKLILRNSSEHGKMAMVYKSEKRTEMVKEGYRILGNSGDQWSDLLGSSMSLRSFKFPNPMYYIP